MAGGILAARKLEEVDIQKLDGVAAGGKQKRFIMPPWGKFFGRISTWIGINIVLVLQVSISDSRIGLEILKVTMYECIFFMCNSCRSDLIQTLRG